MGKKPKVYDNAVIRAIDEGMGWVEEDGSSPSMTADDLGYDCKFIAGSFMSGPAWRDRTTGLWSACVLNYRGITTTLLAKSFEELERMYNLLHRRCAGRQDWRNKISWQQYYSDLWTRRYKRWCCKLPATCDCQLCRIAEGARKKKMRKKRKKGRNDRNS